MPTTLTDRSPHAEGAQGEGLEVSATQEYLDQGSFYIERGEMFKVVKETLLGNIVVGV